MMIMARASDVSPLSCRPHQCIMFAGMNVMSVANENEMNRALGHMCAHTGWIGPGEPLEDGEMSEMTLPSKHRMRNANPGGLRPSTLPIGHRVSPQYWVLQNNFLILIFIWSPFHLYMEKCWNIMYNIQITINLNSQIKLMSRASEIIHSHADDTSVCCLPEWMCYRIAYRVLQNSVLAMLFISS